MKITKQQYNSVPFQYARDVSEGNIVVGLRIKQAVDRFYYWIENCPQDDYLDHAKAMRVINFFPTFLNHTKGRMVGKPFELAPFQQFSLYNIFGWQTPWRDAEGKIKYNSDGSIIYVRRVKKVYDKRGRGNGKTAESAGLGLFMTTIELESEAEVYVAATKEDQAKICVNFAKNYINHPFSNTNIKILNLKVRQNSIDFPELKSTFKPLGRDSKTQDGLAASFAVIDEYHGHASDDLLEVIESSMLKRLQPLVVIITTAGHNIGSVCYQFENVCKEILEGTKIDDSLWIMIHDLDVGDDWENIINWQKANPLWNHGLNIAELKTAYNQTKIQPSKIYNFKTKHLNMWVDGATTWIPKQIWNKCNAPIQEENFKKFGCTGALDLSATIDFTAFAIISEPDEKGIRDLKVYLFCPKETIRKRSKEDKVPYQQWVDEGYIIATDGNMVDYEILEETVVKDVHKFGMKWVEYDRKFSGPLVQNLMKREVELSPFTQTLPNYSHPTKQFERLVYGCKIRHGGNPVLSWMLAGCRTISDTNENIRISKAASTRRIDGIIASIMALGGALTVGNHPIESEYNDESVEITFGI